jgi:Mg/Co/Ni transporter MgtE
LSPPDPITAACTTAAAATASACGLPTGWSILAAMIGSAIGVWAQSERREYELTMRTAITLLMQALVSGVSGVVAATAWGALVPAWVATGQAPAWAAGAALIPHWLIVVAVSASALVLLPILGRLARRLAAGGGQHAP